MRYRSFVALTTLALALVAGCAHRPRLPDAPNLYRESAASNYQSVPEPLRTRRTAVLYATDRRRESADGALSYGSERSHEIDFGLATVAMGEDSTWETLVNASQSGQRSTPFYMELLNIEVRGQSPPRRGVIMQGEGWIEDPQFVRETQEAAAQFHALLEEQLSLTPRKDVFVFVHGYNNKFESAAYRAAQIWHFVGREGVPAMFTWPASSGGLLRGYTQDRESGEFAVSHLKAFLRNIASSPQVRKIHLIAHSRGTDVLVTALKELHVEYRGGGRSTRGELKLGQVVLAAPDMDLDVFIEKLAAERLALAPEQLTLYVSRGDKAIGVAEWLFRSRQRIGRVGVEDLDPQTAAVMEHHPTTSVVNVTARTQGSGHDYFLTSPAALSDLILVLRDGRRPGAEHGRPLIDGDAGFWELRDGYPHSGEPSR